MFNAQLTSFVCTADTGSFNQAAEKLFLSSTAVIKQINALEKHLDLQLFVRTHHGVQLTAAGKVIYRHAKEMFRCSEEAIAEARKAMAADGMMFRVGTSILNPCKPFMDLWNRVSHQFPGYRLHIVPFDDNHTDILTEISSLGEKFDFLIAACDSKQWLNRCHFLPIGMYRHSIAVPADHPLAAKPRLSIRDLYGETVILGKQGDSATVDRVREELEAHPQIQLEDTQQFYDMQVFNHCVETQHLLLTLECWTDVHPSLITFPVDWPYAIPYGILYPLHPSRAIQQFLRVVQKELRR